PAAPVQTRDAAGLKKWTKVPRELGTTIQIRSSLPKVVDPEITKPITWELSFFLPRNVLEKFVGPVGDFKGQQWRGNFFKCAENLSHPHWASWSPVDEFNFHLPRCFGTLLFE
ncbi:MAG: carbohydrate-binding family 9-like protein, partial [Limisphaerales bacterium]